MTMPPKKTTKKGRVSVQNNISENPQVTEVDVAHSENVDEAGETDAECMDPGDMAMGETGGAAPDKPNKESVPRFSHMNKKKSWSSG